MTGTPPTSVTKLIPAVASSWLESLRSKLFRQGTGVLKRGPRAEHPATEDRHCCLGVLSVCLSKDEELSARIESEAGYRWDDEAGQWDPLDCRPDGDIVCDANIPFAVLGLIGLSTPEQDYLIELNDHNGDTFIEIADYIERNLT